MHRIALSTLVALSTSLLACHDADIPWKGQPVDAEGIPALPVPSPLPDDPPSLSEIGQTQQAVGPALETVESCDEVVDKLRAQKAATMIKNVQASFASAWRERVQCLACGDAMYCGGGYGWSDAGVAMPSADAGSMPPTTDPDDPEHSETNNQVVGVDEADTVKTDGKFIYLATADSFRILKSWPADETAEVARVTISGTPKKLFVLGDRALVYAARDNAGKTYSSNECTYGYHCAPTGDGSPYSISVFDITNRSAPKLMREVKVGSSLLAARRIGSAVHSIFTRSGNASFGYLRSTPEGLDACHTSRADIYRAFVELLEDNLQTLREASPADIFPVVEDTVHDNGSTRLNPSPVAGCEDYLASSINDGQQLLTVLSLSIDDQAPAKAVTLVSKPGFVYASAERLYVAVPRQRDYDYGWYEGFEEDPEALTLHQFHLAHDPPAPAYVASGLVKGRVLSQFSMDEFDGHMRVATTTGYAYSTGNAHSTLTVLKQNGDKLEKVGQLDGIAPTEDIRAVRFDGQKAYVVTFKKTDPLFVLDLADPTQPKVLGELKIPGFSTYMQKMDEDHLLTIGYDADDQGSFAWFTGVQLQIFDVKDPTDPQLKFKHVIGTRGSSSEALTNHLAFTYYAPKDVLAIPMTICEGSAGGGSYGTNMTFSGLMVFDVTSSTGFSETGRLSFPQPTGIDCNNWWTDATSQVKRSLIIGDYVYAFSEEELRVAALASPSNALVSLSIK